MQQQNIPIGTLVDMYKRGELRLPEIQRHYVWRATRVRDLLDSLYRGYPSGSILMWETDEPVPTRDFAIAQETTAFAGRKLLLDGQQRLTSLTAVLGGELVQVRGRKRPIDILFNLDHPDGPPTDDTEVTSDEDSPVAADDELGDDAEGVDEGDDNEQGLQEKLNRRTFVVASKNLASLPNWVSVTEVFKTGSDVQILQKAGALSDMQSPEGIARFERYSNRLKKLQAIKGYSYVVHVLERSMSYEEVTEIFVRVNSLGAKLKSSDLALAQMTSRWPNLLKELEAFQEECEKSYFTIDLGHLVRSIVVFATQQCLFRSVAGTPVEKLKEGWTQAQEGLRYAINFLRSNAGIEDESLLSSPMFLHVIAAVSRKKDNKLDADEQRQLLHWLLVANARGRYSRGSTETLLNEDLAIVFRSGDIAAIQWHHVIPKSLLKDKGYETGEINEIANMAFITGQTNRRISNKEASKYLEEVIAKQGMEALESQCVPTDQALWSTGAYRDFLKVRREALAHRMNAFIREKSGT